MSPIECWGSGFNPVDLSSVSENTALNSGTRVDLSVEETRVDEINEFVLFGGIKPLKGSKPKKKFRFSPKQLVHRVFSPGEYDRSYGRLDNANPGGGKHQLKKIVKKSSNPLINQSLSTSQVVPALDMSVLNLSLGSLSGEPAQISKTTDQMRAAMRWPRDTEN